MSGPTLPIFVLEKKANDLMVFSSLGDALSHLEPIDISNNDYVSYDAEGRLLTFETDGKRITAELAEQTPTHAKELESALRYFLTVVEQPGRIVPEMDLRDLIRLSQTHAYQRKLRPGSQQNGA